MDRSEALLAKFGIAPSPADHEEIRQLLKEEIAHHDPAEGCGDYLLLLCYYLFTLGNVEDTDLIWQAKHLNMDTGSMIDAAFLCGAGCEKTLVYLYERPDLKEALAYVKACDPIDLDREHTIQSYTAYFA